MTPCRVMREVTDGSPGRLSALIRIARLRPSDITPAELAEIAAAARSTDTAPEQRSAANTGLGEALERQGRYDEAFEAFATANRLRRAMLTGQIASPERSLFAPPTRSLDPAEAERLDAEQVGFMKAVFTPEFIAAREGAGHHLAAPIFIVGMPRSGSTLIEQILSSHPRVQGLGETGALAEAVGGAFPIKLFAPEGEDHFRKLAEDYLAGMHRRGWGGAPRFIDKMPHNYIHIGMIHLMFPKAVILHSTRDAADTCLANFRIQFQTGQEASYDLGDIGRQYARYREMMAHWNAVLPGRVIEVAHEALVADPEARIRWLVTEACGLEWNAACLAFHKTKRAVRTASVAQVRQPIFTSSVRRWRRYEKHLGPLFDALGPFAPARSPDQAPAEDAAEPMASEATMAPPLAPLDLRACQTVAISLPDDLRRREAVAGLAERAGLRIEIVDGVRAAPARIGCALGHLRILRDKAATLPLMVLEDDVDLTENFRPEIAYPADADALYLGASVWGALELMEYDAYTNLVIAEDVGEPWVRVFNLLGTHAMVYLTARFRDGVIKAIMECLTERDWAHDRGVARIQGEFKVYALRRPMFYQSDALQRPGRRGRGDDPDRVAADTAGPDRFGQRRRRLAADHPGAGGRRAAAVALGLGELSGSSGGQRDERSGHGHRPADRGAGRLTRFPGRRGARATVGGERRAAGVPGLGGLADRIDADPAHPDDRSDHAGLGRAAGSSRHGQPDDAPAARVHLDMAAIRALAVAPGRAGPHAGLGRQHGPGRRSPEGRLSRLPGPLAGHARL